MPVLLILFILLPLIEIGLFIQVGGAIGLWPTLAIVVLTALAGSVLLRRQGGRALADVQRAFLEMRDPTAPLAHGALLMVSGVLLIGPGFFTDACGLLLLIPPVRTWLLSRMARRVVGRVRTGFAPSPQPHRPGVVIDGEFVEAAPSAPRDPTRPPSGWTRH